LFPETKREDMHEPAVVNVLAVEDDPVVRADLRLVLEDAGFAVTDAKDGLEALDRARLCEPDAIVLDLSLPRLGGIEATRRIREERDVPIVALTGRSRRLAEQALYAGAASYVLKPFFPEEIVGAVLTALADHAATSRRTARARAESRRAIAELVTLLGYPEQWATELEERAFSSGRVWRRSG
jgi:CheY-like chemotaxis protein